MAVDIATPSGLEGMDGMARWAGRVPLVMGASSGIIWAAIETLVLCVRIRRQQTLCPVPCQLTLPRRRLPAWMAWSVEPNSQPWSEGHRVASAWPSARLALCGCALGCKAIALHQWTCSMSRQAVMAWTLCSGGPGAWPWSWARRPRGHRLGRRQSTRALQSALDCPRQQQATCKDLQRGSSDIHGIDSK
jgi:hypothetical protein